MPMCRAGKFEPCQSYFKVVASFEFVGGILKCDHSDKSCSKQYFPVVLFYTCQLFLSQTREIFVLS